MKTSRKIGRDLKVSRIFLGGRRGVTLIEILVTIVFVAIAVMGALNFFSYGAGGIKIQGDRRAALQQASARLEELMASNGALVTPPNGTLRWVTCTGSPCTWNFFTTSTPETVPVNGLGNLRTETTVHWIDDPADTTATLDTLDLGVKVWFTSGSTDDANHRIELHSLRTPQ